MNKKTKKQKILFLIIPTLLLAGAFLMSEKASGQAMNVNKTGEMTPILIKISGDVSYNQDKSEITIPVVITNNSDSFFDNLYYTVEIYQGDQLKTEGYLFEGLTYYGGGIFPLEGDASSLSPKKNITTNLKYIHDAGIKSGNYFIKVFVSRKEGVNFGIDYTMNPIALSGSGNTLGFFQCFAKNGDKITYPSEGNPVDKNEKQSVLISMEDNAGMAEKLKNGQYYTYSEVYSKEITGETVGKSEKILISKSENLGKIVLRDNEVNVGWTVSADLPSISKPGTYRSMTVIKDSAGNDVTIPCYTRYVIKGMSGMIGDITSAKNSYKKDDSYDLKVEILGSADNQSVLEGYLTVDLYDKENKQLDSLKEPLLINSTNSYVADFSKFKTKKTYAVDHLKIKLFDKSANQLDESDFKYKEIIGAASETKAQVSYFKIALFVFVVIFIIGLLLMILKKKAIYPFAVFIFFIAVANVCSACSVGYSKDDLYCVGGDAVHVFAISVSSPNCINGLYGWAKSYYNGGVINTWTFEDPGKVASITYGPFSVSGNALRGGPYNSLGSAYATAGDVSEKDANGNGMCNSSGSRTYDVYCGGPENPTATCNNAKRQVTLSWTGLSWADDYWVRLDNLSNGWGNNCGALYSGDKCSTTSSASITYDITLNQAYSWWVHWHDAVYNYGAPSSGSFTCACTASCGAWSACSDCSRSRTCTRADCTTYSETQTCGRVDCVWGGWYNVGSCGDVIACKWLQYRDYNPAAACGGTACVGASSQYVDCGGVDPPIVPSSSMKAECNGAGTQANLSWSSGGGSTAGYSLRVNDTANDNPGCADGWYCVNSPDLATGIIAQNSYTFSVESGVLNRWWVHAVNSCGTYSAPVNGLPFSCSAPTLDFSADPMSVPKNGSSTLTWTPHNVTLCTATGDWNGPKAAANGTYTFPTGALTISETYNLECWNAGTSTGLKTATVHVNECIPPYSRASNSTCCDGGESCSEGLSSDTNINNFDGDIVCSGKCQFKCSDPTAKVDPYNCQAPKKGECNEETEKITFCQAPTDTSCSAGNKCLCKTGTSPGAYLSGNNWEWICDGEFGGDPVPCQAIKSCSFKEVAPN